MVDYKQNMKNKTSHTSKNTSVTSFINIIKIFGFTLGFTITFFAISYFVNEVNYDKCFVQDQDIYLVIKSDQLNNNYRSGISNELFSEFKKIPEILYTTLIFSQGSSGEVLNIKNNYFYYNSISADSCFFRVFKANFICGEEKQFNTQSNSIIITKKIADKHFPKENPVGKTIKMGGYDDMQNYVVAGVIDNWPVKSTIQCDILLKPTQIREDESADMFFSVKKGASLKVVQDKVNKLFSAADKDKDKDKIHLKYQIIPLTDLHFLPANYNLGYGYERGDKTKSVFILVLALGILTIVLINNSVLTIASVTNRLKEMGIRKTFGASQFQLFKTIAQEHFIIIIIAIAISGVLLFSLNSTITSILYPSYTTVGKAKSLFAFQNSYLLTFIFVGIALLSVIIISFVSSVYVNRSKIIDVLHVKRTLNNNKNYLSNLLVIMQLVGSIVMIVSVITVYRQLNYTVTKDYGFDYTNIFYAQVQLETSEPLREELMQHPDIESVTFTFLPTTQSLVIDTLFQNKRPDNKYIICNLPADYNYIKTFGMKIVGGRDFSMQMHDKEENVILINETAASQMAIKYNDLPIETNKGKIIGVVKDFHIRSLKEKIFPIYLNLTYRPCIILKVKPINALNRVCSDSSITAFMVEVFKKYDHRTYEMYTRPNFLIGENDNISIHNGLVEWSKWKRINAKTDFENEYSEDHDIGNIGLFLAILASVITALGFLGVSIFTSVKRTKEIGMRKVSGATTLTIIRLFVKEYAIKVCIALAVAYPIANYCVNKYLETFAYHVSITPWVFVISGIITLAIVLAAVSWQTWRAANQNPVEALRSE